MEDDRMVEVEKAVDYFLALEEKCESVYCSHGLRVDRCWEGCGVGK